MKKILLVFSFSVFITGSITNQIANAQIRYIQEYKETTCTTNYCDVVVRQYTGMVTAWRMSVRCLDQSGNWSDWQINTGDGLYSGTVCNGVSVN